jgi:hypothetical protein
MHLVLTDAREHDHAHRALASTPLLPLLTALAPYREAMLARLAEAAPLVPALGLFQLHPRLRRRRRLPRRGGHQPRAAA